MTVYSDYSADERRLLLVSLEAAAAAVSAASPGRKEEMVSEGFAAASFVLGSRAAYVDNALVSSVILALETRVQGQESVPDYVEVASRSDAGPRAMGALRAVAELLDAKATPDEAIGYKGWLLQVATTTAEAGKEDQGFLGRGGVQVNDAERAALRDIAEVLGIEA